MAINSLGLRIMSVFRGQGLIMIGGHVISKGSLIATVSQKQEM